MDPSAGVFQEESIVLYTHRIGEFQESQNIALHSLPLSAPNHWGNTAFTSTCSGCFLLLLHCNGALGLHLWKGILVVGFKTSEPASISKYTQIKFPAVLTYKYTVDKNLLFDLRARTMGNSPTSIHTLINLVHSDSYIKLSVMYLEDVKRHQAALKMHCCPAATYSEVPPMTPVPTPKWFLSAYVHDVMFRKDTLKGSITSAFGEIIKIDSTKKILKKYKVTTRKAPAGSPMLETNTELSSNQRW